MCEAVVRQLTHLNAGVLLTIPQELLHVFDYRELDPVLSGKGL